MEILGKRKYMAYFAVIFFLTIITIFLVLEFGFLKRVISENNDNIRRIIVNEIYSYMNDIRFYTENSAMYFSDGQLSAGRNREDLIKRIAGGDQRIMGVYLLDKDGRVLDSLSGQRGIVYPDPDFKRGMEGRPFVFGVKSGEDTGILAVSALISERGEPMGYLVIDYEINDLKNKFLFKYSTDELKVSLFDSDNSPLIWAFKPDVLGEMDLGRDGCRVDGVNYGLTRVPLDYSGVQVYFFNKKNNFDTYRIITIMFLLFVLYFLIYQFIVELLNVNNINSYFDNIDFNIFNNLKEGIIIANKFNKVVFANHVIHEIFPEKNIDLKKTDLKDIIGPVSGLGTRMTLKKSNNLLEIICSPIFKNGKMLGSLVVVGPSLEKEKLCGNALEKIMELSQDGVVFVDKDNKIISFNMMASYYLGNMANEMDVNDVNSELGSLIEGHMGSISITRAGLSFGNIMCELIPVNDDNSFYAGMVVLIKDSRKNQ